MLRGVYAITSGQTSTALLLNEVQQALDGGIKVLQYRQKRLSYSQQIKQAELLLTYCRDYNCLFLINDNPRLAAEIAADGVHLGQSDTDIVKARELIGPEAIIGITCHDSLKLAQQAELKGADYVAFGAFFPSCSKPDANLAPLSLLTQAKKTLHCPVIAIGGINPDNAKQLINAGADMIAAIHALFASENISAQCTHFNQLFKGL